ncbi:formamidase, partial [Haematococcus lacustris]
MKKPKETLVKVDINKPGNEQPTPLHNRWHPDIPPVGTAEVDQMYRIECIVVDKSGAPALPGDLLVVEISNIGALEGSEWGYCGIFDRENGGGFLTDHFPNACKASSGRQGTAGGKAVWDFEGIYCSSRHIPGVRFAGIIHPGLIGTAPSHELLEIWNKRETQLVEEGDKAITLGGILHSRPLALLPEPEGALLGSLTREHPDWERIAKSGSRTIPPRENGGNCDIKNLT